MAALPPLIGSSSFHSTGCFRSDPACLHAFTAPAGLGRRSIGHRNIGQCVKIFPQRTKPFREAVGFEEWSAGKTQAALDVPISREVDVAIVGGGPGGLAAANAIKKTSPDLSIAVFERAGGLHRIGWAIGVAYNGMHAIQAISQELYDEVAKYSINKGGATLDLEDNVLSKGSIFYPIVEGHEDTQPGFVPWYILQRTFAANLPTDCLQLGHTFEALEQDEDGVVLQFTNGSASVGVRAKVVIGADGNQSGVRQSLFEDGPPKFLNTAVWRGQCTMPPDWPFKEQMMTGWRDAELSNYFLVIQLPGDALAWQLMGTCPAEGLKELSSARYVDTDAIKGSVRTKLDRCLSKMTGRFPRWPMELVQSTELARVTEHGQFYREAADCLKWTKGRVTLLGDAAHLFTPFLGQGVNQTLEDAVEVGRSIGKLGASTEALLDYEAERASYATRIQGASVQIAKDIFMNKLSREKEGRTVNREQAWRDANPNVRTRRSVPLERVVVR